MIWKKKRSGCPTKGRNRGGVGGGLSLQAKNLNFPLLLDIPPPPLPLSKHWSTYSSPNRRPPLRKKIYLIAFRQILPKMFVCHMHFQLQNHSLFEKLLGTKSFNIRQCPAGLSTRIILLYSPSGQKCLLRLIALLPPPGVDYPLSPKSLWESMGMRRESHPTAKNLLIFLTRKTRLNKFTASPIKNVIFPYQLAILM